MEEDKVLIRLKTYAMMSGITYNGVKKRIALGKLKAENIDGVLFIDISKYPVLSSVRIRKKS